MLSSVADQRIKGALEPSLRGSHLDMDAYRVVTSGVYDADGEAPKKEADCLMRSVDKSEQNKQIVR